MAFTLQVHIQQKKLRFKKPQFNMQELLIKCGLQYGSTNEFYILEEEIKGDTAILYNPNRIGRGVFCDMGQISSGMIEMSYNIPTTKAEIDDFLAIVLEVKRQLIDIELYCVEEERHLTVEELLANRDNMVSFSLQSLKKFCANKEYQAYIFTLAKFPYTLTKEQVEYFETCEDLNEFEQLLHNKQAMDVYYAKSSLYRNKETQKIGAFYTLTEACESVFPIAVDQQVKLAMSDIKIDDGFISFFLLSENRMIEGYYNYNQFIKVMLEKGATFFDGDHILVAPMTKEQIEQVIEEYLL